MPEKNKEPNSNCLEGMRCPECGSTGPFEIQVRVWVTMDEGVILDMEDAWEGSDGWDDESPVCCQNCAYKGMAGDLLEEEAPAPKPKKQTLITWKKDGENGTDYISRDGVYTIKKKGRIHPYNLYRKGNFVCAERQLKSAKRAAEAIEKKIPRYATFNTVGKE